MKIDITAVKRPAFKPFWIHIVVETLEDSDSLLRCLGKGGNSNEVYQVWKALGDYLRREDSAKEGDGE